MLNVTVHNGDEIHTVLVETVESENSTGVFVDEDAVRALYPTSHIHRETPSVTTLRGDRTGEWAANGRSVFRLETLPGFIRAEEIEDNAITAIDRDGDSVRVEFIDHAVHVRIANPSEDYMTVVLTRAQWAALAGFAPAAGK